VKQFLSQFGHLVAGVLNGFDRLVFHGFLRRLCYPDGLEGFLAFRNILRKDLGAFAEQSTQLTKDASLKPAVEQGVPIQHVPPSADKDKLARHHRQERQVETGPICVLTSVEPCSIWHVHRSKDKKRILFERRHGRCQHLYHYLQHPDFGLMHVRLQTWMPYEIQVYVNGREWLARQMRTAGMRFRQDDNCFPWIEDVPQAQKLMDRFTKLPWQTLLNGFAQQVHPVLDQILGGFQVPYFWTAHQSEWATDVMFKDPDDLNRLMPAIIRHGMSNLHSNDVFRFLGKKLHGNFQGEVLTKFRRRREGVCVKFFADRNSLKLYQKLQWLLRVETTINHPKFFPVLRRAEGQGPESKRLRPLRKGIADMLLRANVSQATNKRCLDNIATIGEPTSVKDLVDEISKPTILAGRRVRALQPWSPNDLQLLTAVTTGEFLAHGFRNRDIVRRLFANPTDDATERKRRSAQVSRKLRLLRAHGLIEKVPHSHRYLLTKRGAATIAAILAVRDTPLAALKQVAA
jgi:hypothetical protein